jgi:hypothetical protein
LIRRVLQEEQRLKEVTSLEAKDTTSALMVRKGNLNSKENVSSVVKMGIWKPTATWRKIRMKTKDSKEDVLNVE